MGQPFDGLDQHLNEVAQQFGGFGDSQSPNFQGGDVTDEATTNSRAHLVPRRVSQLPLVIFVPDGNGNWRRSQSLY